MTHPDPRPSAAAPSDGRDLVVRVTLADIDPDRLRLWDFRPPRRRGAPPPPPPPQSAFQMNEFFR